MNQTSKLSVAIELIEKRIAECSIKLHETKENKELNKKYSGKVVFVNVADENVKDLEQAKKLWKQAVKEDGMTWTQILNNEGKEEQDLLKLYNITSFPTKILIDPEGKVVARLVGATADPEEFLKAL